MNSSETNQNNQYQINLEEKKAMQINHYVTTLNSSKTTESNVVGFCYKHKCFVSIHQAKKRSCHECGAMDRRNEKYWEERSKRIEVKKRNKKKRKEELDKKLNELLEKRKANRSS